MSESDLTAPDVTATATAEDTFSRSERKRGDRRRRRPWIVAATLAIIALLAAATWAGWSWWSDASAQPPSKVVVIGESTLEDETKVAGLVAVVDLSAASPKVTVLDSGATRAIPGTSFDRLRDALSMGGPELVASLSAGEDAGWIILSQPAWASLIDDQGGIELVVPKATTVFTGQELYRFAAGPARLTGAQAGALLLGAENLGDDADTTAIRKTLASALAQALLRDPGALSEMAKGEGTAPPGAQSSIDFATLPQLLQGR